MIDIIGSADLAALLTMDDAIKLVKTAMIDVSAARSWAPHRWVEQLERGGAMALMPGGMFSDNRFGIKVLSLFKPAARGSLSGHQGAMLLFDSVDGRPLAIVEASSLTALRTAAATAVATDALSRPQSRVLALLGAGAQAVRHVEAMTAVRSFDEIRIWARDRTKAETFAENHLRGFKTVTVANDAQTAIIGADVVCTLTHSDTAVVRGEWLERGQHLNLIGASTAASREVDVEAVRRSRYFADSRANALLQAGELRDAIAAGIVGEDHIAAEIGEVLGDAATGREGPDQITIYKSLGHVAQDIAVAGRAFELTSARQWHGRLPW
ncbi:ornithine cyclodeaminase family protein [Sphingomonas sp. HF-S3]|uniref:Ornithine cyclodeaminase family protein n=1 Tax=Sphingomonas rustica TaxID=3103142 RepID=A0ABV0B509_9SPHN